MPLQAAIRCMDKYHVDSPDTKELSQILTDKYPHVFSEPGRFAPSWFDHNRTTAFINAVRSTRASKV